jgi:condensin-2 complex subunit D3
LVSVIPPARLCMDALCASGILELQKFIPSQRGADLNSFLYLWLQFHFLFFFFSSRYLNKAFHIWSKKDKFSSTFINNVISHTGLEHSSPAWMLLSKIACSSPKLDYTKIMQSWEKTSRFACLYIAQ